MSITAFKEVALRGSSKALLITKKYSPEILTTVGVIGVVTAGVFAAKATLQLEPLVDKAKHNLDGVADGDKKGKTKVMISSSLDIAKLYGPSVTVGLASIACIIGAHGIMRRRNVALVAALNVVETAYAKYRERVIDEFGIEKDLDYRMGTRDIVIEDEETGKEKTVTEIDLNAGAPYAQLFDEANRYWQKTPDHNRMIIENVQQHMNDKLRAQGYLFLNDVYDALGFDRTKAGQIVGWVWEKDNEVGDNWVDFGIYDLYSTEKREFVAGFERSIWLDFNVDGPVLNRIKF